MFFSNLIACQQSRCIPAPPSPSSGMQRPVQGMLFTVIRAGKQKQLVLYFDSHLSTCLSVRTTETEVNLTGCYNNNYYNNNIYSLSSL